MNSELYGNDYQIPQPILEKIRVKLYNASDAEGIKRAKNLLKSGTCTYQNLKRLKNFFDNFNPSTMAIEQFELAGGREMRNYVDVILRKERDRVEHSQNLKQDINLDLSPQKAQNGTVNLAEAIEEDNIKYRNAIAVIFNSDNEILIAKRNPKIEQWMPNKWALFGGSIEAEETAEQAVQREIMEEANIKIDKFLKKAVVEKDEARDHIFLALYNQEKHGDIQINDEHIDYMFCSFNNLKYYDCVPNLKEYIKLAVEK